MNPAGAVYSLVVFNTLPASFCDGNNAKYAAHLHFLEPL